MGARFEVRVLSTREAEIAAWYRCDMEGAAGTHVEHLAIRFPGQRLTILGTTLGTRIIARVAGSQSPGTQNRSATSHDPAG